MILSKVSLQIESLDSLREFNPFFMAYILERDAFENRITDVILSKVSLQIESLDSLREFNPFFMENMF
ncbi:MAG: hypothetical protein AAF617_04070, partial [Bacteroidota bacterium]